jgi:quinol---cytochrome-c reductase cytochrome c subunit
VQAVVRGLAATVAVGTLLASVGSAVAAPPTRGGLVARGDHLYGRYCLACHGANGAGSTRPGGRIIGAGPNREQGQEQAVAPPLVGVGALAADFYLRTGYMPLQHLGLQPRRGPVPFSEEQIRALVAYVASLGPGPAVPTPHPERGSLSGGEQLFADHCAGCHQIVARGGYVTGAVPPALTAASPTQIAEAVRIGPYVMPRFSRHALSNRQLDSVIRYVEYAKRPQHPGGWSIGYLGPVPEGLVTWFLAMAALVVVCVALGRRLRSR